MTRTSRALPPARWRKGTTGFLGWCGFNGLVHRSPRSIKPPVHSIPQCHQGIKGQNPSVVFLEWQGDPKNSILEAEMTNWEGVGKTSHSVWPWGPVHQWRRLPQERILQGIEDALEMEDINQLSTLPGRSEVPSVTWLLWVSMPNQILC